MNARVAVLLTLCTAAPLAAQTGISYGTSTTGWLMLADSQLSDGSRYRAYAFTGGRGDTIVAELTSDDFDAVLLLMDDAGNRLTANDDAGSRCNARLEQVLPVEGRYRLYVNTASASGLGEYELRLTRGTRPAASDTTCRHFLGLRGIVQVGESLSAVLTGKDLTFSDSTHFRRYTLPVRANQTFTVDLRSDEFDAFLLLETGRGEQLVRNDNGAGGCHARIVYTAPDDHPLVVVANTARPHESGHFTLILREGSMPTEPKSVCRPAVGTLTVGESKRGTLTTTDRLLTADSTYAQPWRLPGRQGEQVTIKLASKDFDAFLLVIGPGLESPLQDDDSGGDCNAQLTIAFPESGEYFVFVNTARKLATGTFVLSVTAGAATAAPPTSCSRSP